MDTLVSLFIVRLQAVEHLLLSRNFIDVLLGFPCTYTMKDELMMAARHLIYFM